MMGICAFMRAGSVRGIAIRRAGGGEIMIIRRVLGLRLRF